MKPFHHVNAVASVKDLLRSLGEDPDREGLQRTPERSAKAWAELTRGYHEDAAAILSVTFGGTNYQGIVAVRDVEFYSLCEHHLLPFHGKASIAYVPGSSHRVVGLSKLARLVDVFARRLQVQERMTAQIADAIEQHLEAAGVVVIIDAAHSCMRMRGVGKQSSSMVTSEVRGVFREQAAARAEAFELLR